MPSGIVFKSISAICNWWQALTCSMAGSLAVFGVQVQVVSEVRGGNAVDERVACT